MGSENILNSYDQDLPQLMLRTEKNILNEGSISVKQNETRMKRSSGTILVADKAVEEQDILSNKMPRTKRSSTTGLVADKSVEEQVVGEEERSVVGCGEVVLDCPSSTMIVVRSASFTPLGEGSRPAACTTRGLGGNNQAIWRAVVDACSGSRKGKCTFSLEEHLRESKAWGLGRTEVRYTCVANLHSYCGGRVEAGGGPGYLASPGYPQFYLGGRECVWSLVADQGQTVLLMLGDLSLRRTGTNGCEDSVVIREEGSTLLELCGDLASPVTVQSYSHQLEVRMRTAPSGQQVYSKRGVLLRYVPQGCATPPPISEGSAVFVNSTHAHMLCSTGHVFRSSLQQDVWLHCRAWLWSPPVEHCVSLKFLLQYGNSSVVRAIGSHYEKLAQVSVLSPGEWRMEVVATVMVIFLLKISKQFGRNPCHQRKCFHVNKFQIINT